MTKVYCIKKVYISDDLPELDTEVYATEEARDAAWHRLVHDHNNMIQDAYNIDLNNSNYEKDFHYDWDNQTLTFYDKVEPTCHYDYFEKSEETLYE